MNRLNLVLVIALASLGLTASGCGGSGGGDAAPAAEETAAPAAADAPAAGADADAGDAEGEAEERPRFIAPIRGVAEIAYLKPNTRVISGDVVTTIRLQNRATGAIAGLKVDEFWWDESGNPLPGDSQRIRQPLMPGEVATIELRVPRDSRMNRNNYSFSHANGEIKATLVTELPEEEEEEEEEEEDEGEPTER